MRRGLLPAILLWCCFALGCPLIALADAGSRPNVLLVIIDDLNVDLQNYGHTVQKTPNISRVADRGVTFLHAYAQYPQCNQSRTSVLTGVYPAQAGVLGLEDHFRDNLPDIVTLPEHFRNNGYRTARVGKVFHQGVPGDIGTDGLDDARSWDIAINPKGVERSFDPVVKSIAPTGRERPGLGGLLSWLSVPGDGSDLVDHQVADTAIEILHDFASRQEAQPFFLAVGFYRPHTPFIAPEGNFSDYPADELELPDATMSDRDDKPVAALADRPFQLEMTDDQKRNAIQGYRAAVSFVDAQVGRLMESVEELGLADDTIIVLMSDHGYQLGQHLLWQKGDLFEQSVRTPLVIAAPGGQRGGRVEDAIVELVDVYPTIVSLAGMDMPQQHSAGRDLRPLLLDGRVEDRMAFTQSWSRAGWTRPGQGLGEIMGLSIRDSRYRYTEWGGGANGAELYDYDADPHEVTNLASSAYHAEVLARMRAQLKAAARRAGAD